MEGRRRLVLQLTILFFPITAPTYPTISSTYTLPSTDDPCPSKESLKVTGATVKSTKFALEGLNSSCLLFEAAKRSENYRFKLAAHFEQFHWESCSVILEIFLNGNDSTRAVTQLSCGNKKPERQLTSLSDSILFKIRRNSTDVGRFGFHLVLASYSVGKQNNNISLEAKRKEKNFILSSYRNKIDRESESVKQIVIVKKKCLYYISKLEENCVDFRCQTGLCIAENLVCDSVNHCSDGSDERPRACANRNMIGNKGKVGLGVVIGLTLGLLLLCVFGMVGLSICCKRGSTLQRYGETPTTLAENKADQRFDQTASTVLQNKYMPVPPSQCVACRSDAESRGH
ncbi:DgyrCDS2462 [Dimorphilus gyrociliatus]|uniref:DgyrCDS2462 n=1 Tax=Dimorphilus gyrociliatus TaxID=2664684 RepID=A0A7I8VAK5_9ANNE|nr:DgyrCDS2462 [Dimorphilus gyrociliatus]